MSKPKKLLFSIFSTTGKLFDYISQRWICCVSQNTNSYKWFPFNNNFATVRNYAFSKHMRIMNTSWPSYHYAEKKL